MSLQDCSDCPEAVVPQVDNTPCPCSDTGYIEDQCVNITNQFVTFNLPVDSKLIDLLTALDAEIAELRSRLNTLENV